MNIRIWMCAGIFGLIASSSLVVKDVSAHGGATGIVKQRMDAMSEMARSMKTIGGMVRSKTPYDAEAVRKAAAYMELHGGTELTKLFPEGSLMKPSEAKPDIWQDWETFKAQADDLKNSAAVLKDMSGNGLASLGADGVLSVRQAFAAVGKTCSACHQKFRIKKD
ncbi:c-type cytochrome [Roseibium algae]|uniref:Cytochrome c n=1 Tax=Roseibium algae TaxID=3123038 RepID=A0ABU8TLM5_9HYPH